MTHKFLNLCDILSLVCLDLYRFLLFCFQKRRGLSFEPVNEMRLIRAYIGAVKLFFQKICIGRFRVRKA